MKQKINWGRVVLGGLLAGIVINTFEFVVNYFVLREDWKAAAINTNVNAPATPAAQAADVVANEQLLMSGGEIALWNLWGFLAGFLALWVYASLRKSLGPGVKTGIIAGTLTWAIVTAVGAAVSSLATLHLTVWMSLSITAIITSYVVGFAGFNLGTLLGAWQYLDSESGITGTGKEI